MAEFLDELRDDATMGDVFHEVYGRVDALIKELDAIRVDEYGEGSSQRPIPGTALEMDWSAGLGDAGEAFRSTSLYGVAGGESNPLVRLSTDTPAATKYRNPASVTGFRANETGGDYSLNKRYRSSIESRLGLYGLFRSRATVRADEGGLSEIVTEWEGTKITDLLPVERAQLLVVTRGILDNVTAVEFIRDGVPTQDVFEMMGREPVSY